MYFSLKNDIAFLKGEDFYYHIDDSFHKGGFRIKESTLLNQEFIKDNKLSIRQYLQSIDKDLTVTAFKRYALS